MIKVDRDKFWELYRNSFGSVTQVTVDALNYILDRFETENRLNGIAQHSYVLATSYHETGKDGNHFAPVKEGRERSNSPRRYNQDKYWLTGYYGRGHIQVTWKENYSKLGKELGVGDLFVENPDLLLTDQWGYESLVYGMSKGLYRGDSRGRKKLSRYLKGDDETLDHYYAARDIVNGDLKKNGMTIAKYANKFEFIFLNSRISEEGPAESLPNSQPAETFVSSNVAPENQPPPSIWDKMGGWQEKLDKLNSFGSSLSPISGSSKLTVITTKAGGWALLALGFFSDHWLWLVGTILIITAVIYLALAKRNANSRVISATPAVEQKQTVVVQ